jgi:hypothetical protein
LIEGVGMNDLDSVTFNKGRSVTFDPIDDKSVRLQALRALSVTSEAATQTLALKFTSEQKAKPISLEVVNTKVETVTK